MVIQIDIEAFQCAETSFSSSCWNWKCGWNLSSLLSSLFPRVYLACLSSLFPREQSTVHPTLVIDQMWANYGPHSSRTYLDSTYLEAMLK